MDQHNNIVDSKGNIIASYPPCAYEPIRVGPFNPSAGGPSPTLQGWVEWAFQSSGSNQFNALQNYYHVPSAPSNYGGQTDFFFPGFVPVDNSVIIQTVLQYGPSKAGGGNYWGLAAWWVANNGNQYYSPLYTGVSSGDLIFNKIYIQSQTCNYSGCYDLWNIYGEDENTQYAFGANLWQDTEDPMNQAFGAVMEDYNVTSCNQLPAQGNIDFYDMALFEPGSCGVTCYNQVTYNSSSNFGQNNPSCGYSMLNGSGGSILYWSPLRIWS